MEKADIGLIGLGVMGQNLALNLANKGWKVVVWNRTVPGKEENVVEHFIANRAKGKGIIGSNELTDFVEALKTPRVILLMVQAGPAVDELTGKLFPLMEKGDILIDGGNSYYEDTERRVKELYDKGMYFEVAAFQEVRRVLCMERPSCPVVRKRHGQSFSRC